MKRRRDDRRSRGVGVVMRCDGRRRKSHSSMNHVTACPKSSSILLQLGPRTDPVLDEDGVGSPKSGGCVHRTKAPDGNEYLSADETAWTMQLPMAGAANHCDRATNAHLRPD